MIKYTAAQVVFSEIPNEIALAVDISNCIHNCPGCHSPELRKNIGEQLDFSAVNGLIEKNRGITCFLFLGEGNDLESLKEDIFYIRKHFPDLKVALYSGRKEVKESFLWEGLDYLKIGPYIESLGPLNKETTNQRLYKKNENGSWDDITKEFWRKKA